MFVMYLVMPSVVVQVDKIGLLVPLPSILLLAVVFSLDYQKVVNQRLLIFILY